METTSARLWKRLPAADRLAAAAHFWREAPEAMVPAALAAIVGARKVRPQVVRTWGDEERARGLSQVLDLGEPLASSLLVALHVGARRAMLVGFLDAAGIAHEDGLLKEDDGTPVTEDAARAGVEALRAAWPAAQVDVYLNTLWLQDPDRWGALEPLLGAP
ncbi:MAG TPA: hypothetical protein VII13_12015 [Vicinamibacteria bacterium]|jgi:hypothetical protein